MSLVSVVIPLFNKSSSIERTIDSILSQDYQKIEIIVVDDGSTDTSSRVVKNLKNDRVKYFYKENGGVSSARNYGVSVSKGEYVMFIDADDIMLPGAISGLMQTLHFYHARIAVGGAKLDPSGCELYVANIKRLDSRPLKSVFYDRLPLLTGCALIRKDIAESNLYDTKYTLYEDCDYYLRLYSKDKVAVYPEPVLLYQKKFSQLSKTYPTRNNSFVYNINFSHKPLWYKLSLAKVFIMSGDCSWKTIKSIKNQRMRYIIYVFCAKILIFIKSRYNLIFSKQK